MPSGIGHAQLCAQLYTFCAAGRLQRVDGAADVHTQVQTCAQLCTFVQKCAQLCRLVHSCVHNSAHLGQRFDGHGSRGAAGGYAHSCADLCTAVLTCAQLYGLVHNCAELCTALQTCVQLCQICATYRRPRVGGAVHTHTTVQTCARLCRLVHRCVYKSAQLGHRVGGTRVEGQRTCTDVCTTLHILCSGSVATGT